MCIFVGFVLNSKSLMHGCEACNGNLCLTNCVGYEQTAVAWVKIWLQCRSESATVISTTVCRIQTFSAVMNIRKGEYFMAQMFQGNVKKTVRSAKYFVLVEVTDILIPPVKSEWYACTKMKATRMNNKIDVIPLPPPSPPF